MATINDPSALPLSPHSDLEAPISFDKVGTGAQSHFGGVMARREVVVKANPL